MRRLSMFNETSVRCDVPLVKMIAVCVVLGLFSK